jgi:hypothetical protein
MVNEICDASKKRFRADTELAVKVNHIRINVLKMCYQICNIGLLQQFEAYYGQPSGDTVPQASPSHT